MRQLGGWTLTVLVLSLATAARGEELTCEFDEGTRSVAHLDEASGWGWGSTAQRPSELLGVRPGASFWFMRARFTDGATQGALAGSYAPPATDYWAATVHRRPSQVILVEVVSDSIRVLAVSTAQGRDGRLAATYSSQSGGADSQSVEQFTGSCRRTDATEAP
jgi:hypothetical protein